VRRPLLKGKRGHLNKFNNLTFFTMSDQEKNISQNKEEKKADSWWSLEEGFLEKKDRDLIERENNKGPEKEPNMDNTVDLIKEKIVKRAIVVDD
jgi:hypothetical protein